MESKCCVTNEWHCIALRWHNHFYLSYFIFFLYNIAPINGHFWQKREEITPLFLQIFDIIPSAQGWANIEKLAQTNIWIYSKKCNILERIFEYSMIFILNIWIFEYLCIELLPAKIWHLTQETWHVSHRNVNIVSKFQVPSSYGLRV